MTKEERTAHEHSLSEKYIERHGERANNVRLCTNLYFNYTSEDFWVEKTWVKDSKLKFLDDGRYNDWVVNAPAGSKPWVIAWGDTPIGKPATT